MVAQTKKRGARPAQQLGKCPILFFKNPYALLYRGLHYSMYIAHFNLFKISGKILFAKVGRVNIRYNVKYT